MAGMVVIGNEILTGKVTDVNSPFLCRELNFLGLELGRITTIGDDFDTIGQVVREFSHEFTWVFTSGGIGPTHDDITIKAIAAGFGVEALRHPQLEASLRSHYAERLTEDHLLMSLVPEGAELLEIPGWSFHQVLFRNIFIMPGVPQLFQHRFDAFKHRFQGTPVLLKEFYLKADEGAIASILREVDEQYSQVLIGSYPNFRSKEYSVKVTVEARDKEALSAAAASLQHQLEALPVTIVRVS